MSISVYRKLNKNWMADVALNSIRRTKTFDKKLMQQTGPDLLNQN